MRIRLHRKFKKSYKIRISLNKKLVLQTETRINLFKANLRNPLLENHELSGAKKGLDSFSVTGDIRITYMPISEDEVIFMDIGSHNQVY
ncbi:MAG: type II toxin-antitoxin system mRNA interferase toxin, RelE/StbE family [Candidatus Daviesbacteria bacterium]|nr:type II toxin-antitoxin system mRNA interferase toxin, RelE/StbE family [Candidatus Daviesbacteria bacterium]